MFRGFESLIFRKTNIRRGFQNADKTIKTDQEITKKQIEKAAGNMSEHPFIEIERQGFIRGAEWRINSVWHDVSERPDERRAVIIEYGENRISLHEKGYCSPWKYNVEQFGFKRWAYIKDLLP